MAIFEMIMVGIGIVVGLIVLVVLVAFLVELVKAFGQIGDCLLYTSDAADE